MRLAVLDVAQDDIDTAVAWYEERAAGSEIGFWMKSRGPLSVSWRIRSPTRNATVSCAEPH